MTRIWFYLVLLPLSKWALKNESFNYFKALYKGDYIAAFHYEKRVKEGISMIEELKKKINNKE